jgi:hypothetical protein
VTDLPRRSYPLVVPPPGGFEEAVRRGRRLRRRRAGSGTGAALALVAVLAYTMSGQEGGTSGLQPTEDAPYAQQSERPGTGTASPTPEPTASSSNDVSASPSPGGTGGSEGGYVPGYPTTPAGPTLPATPSPDRSPGRPFAARDDITETPSAATAATTCAPTEINPWCAFANVTPVESATRIDYWLSYTLCRHVSAGDRDLDYTILREVDFSVRYLNDTFWTYSKGWKDQPGSPQTRVTAGGCVEWKTLWDGYDDYGFTPQGDPGQYQLKAWSTGTADGEALPQATRSFPQ